MFLRMLTSLQVVYLLIPTSNHNRKYDENKKENVVYLLIPTSNHNSTTCRLVLSVLYIFWFLHQTTTCSRLYTQIHSCISFDSYIKPQQKVRWEQKGKCCISFDSYIKPQLQDQYRRGLNVVYLLIPTSNHNRSGIRIHSGKLYIFWFLHQTTTCWVC